MTSGSAPFQLAAGVKVQAPVAAMVSVPLPARVMVPPAVAVPTPATVKELMRAELLRNSSLVRTLPVRTVSSTPVATSSTAPRLTTLNWRVAAEVRVPSVMT